MNTEQITTSHLVLCRFMLKMVHALRDSNDNIGMVVPWVQESAYDKSAVINVNITSDESGGLKRLIIQQIQLQLAGDIVLRAIEEIISHAYSSGFDMIIVAEEDANIRTILTRNGFRPLGDTRGLIRGAIMGCPFCGRFPEVTTTGGDGVIISCANDACSTEGRLEVGPFPYAFESCMAWNSRHSGIDWKAYEDACLVSGGKKITPLPKQHGSSAA